MTQQVWIILSIVLVASLAFIVCALAYIVATRVLPSAGAMLAKGRGEKDRAFALRAMSQPRSE
jgi:hypothetical protein